MDTEALKEEIDTLITVLGEDANRAKPAAERAVLDNIRLLLEHTHDRRTGDLRDIWEYYLPYAARLCYQLSRLEEGWAEELEYFACENAQFWLDNANALLDAGEISRVHHALGQILESSRLIKQDFILRVEILLQALEIALEVSDKKHSIQIYEEAEKIYRKHLAGGDQYTGSAWLRKIKKMGQQLNHSQDKLRRYYHHAESVIVSIEAETQGDLERVIDYLQQSLPGKIKITRRITETDKKAKAAGFRARVKIRLE